VRELADKETAPYAADVDKAAEFPQQAYDALRRKRLSRPHIPEIYGGTAPTRSPPAS
jgi:alkylation response protein AidB-like acyl-CoA dehydrogenase